tara:strand:- start:211 stop:585 length:375 start_codon:yes stop_codon:yes gene_type:complete
MNVLKINIGLNNNPLNAEQIKQMFYKNSIFEFILFEERKGEYLNNYEPTLIIEGETNQTPEQIESYIFLLCTLLTQECIPYTFVDLLSEENNQVNKLVYNNTFEGLKYEFNKDYFLTIGNNINN